MTFTTTQKLDYLKAQKDAATALEMWELVTAIDEAIQSLERLNESVALGNTQRTDKTRYFIQKVNQRVFVFLPEEEKGYGYWKDTEEFTADKGNIPWTLEEMNGWAQEASKEEAEEYLGRKI